MKSQYDLESNLQCIPKQTIPIGSMGMVYLPTGMVGFYGKFRQIYHTWISCDIVETESTANLACIKRL